MRTLPKIIIWTFILTSCTGKERSEIEVIKYDRQLVKDIQSTHDSVYTETPKRKDFWIIEHYLTGSTKEKIILKDSLENIIGIVIRENGINSFAQEYYANGQLKGKTDFVPGKIEGPAKYYYEDGRIKSRGEWFDYKQIGEWKDYDKEGYLILIKHYDDNGKLIREEKLK
jgi:antitoxin component YwqK of YwqJK toxin-antitoxin module